MSKVMIVEDDESLREIYAIRLTAEGYAVVSARDGEEALAVAVRERPDLIISDVMMPKISGFDMLDILRSTPETQNIKVIMMTALSSEDQRVRGENLGADRYIVKSQVGIEDVINVVHEVLGDRDPSNGTISAEVPGSTPGLGLGSSQPVAPVASASSPASQAANVPAAPAFTPADQTTNTPTQAMPPIPSASPAPAVPVSPAGAAPSAGVIPPVEPVPPVPPVQEQPSAVPPSIMPPVSTGL